MGTYILKLWLRGGYRDHPDEFFINRSMEQNFKPFDDGPRLPKDSLKDLFPHASTETIKQKEEIISKERKSMTNNHEIVTTEPYSPNERENRTRNSKHNRRKYKPDPTLVHFNTLIGTNNWPRYLVFQSEEDMKAVELENILLKKYPSRETSFRPINRKEWIVEATSKDQSECYQSLDNINGINVSVQRHDKLNSIEGTVVLPPTNNCDGLPDEDVLLESLRIRYDNIEKVKVYKIPNRRNLDRTLRIAKITF